MAGYMGRKQHIYRPYEDGDEPVEQIEVSLCTPDEDYDYARDREIEIYEETLSEFAGD